MTKKSKVPQIRFKGFIDEWDNKELTNYSSKIGDGLHGTPKYVSNTGIYFINGNNLESGSIHITDETKEVSKEDSLKNDKQLNSNTILMSINGTIGNLAWYQNETIMLGKSVAYITLKNCDKSYMYCYLQSTKIRNNFFNNLTGSTIKNLGLKTIRETEISIPKEIAEQTKIGDYFHKLDKIIEQKEKKYQKLKQFKKAMLDKMFPKNGTDTPEIRFKGFSGKWEEKKLGDIGNTYTGLSGKTKEDFGHGEGKFVTYMNVFSNPISKQNLTEPIEIDEKQNEVQFGDVFFTTSSETPEEVGMTSVWMNKEKNIYLNSFCFAYRPEKVFDNYYLAYMLRSSSIRKKIVFLAQGISRYNISKNKVMEIYVPIPHIEEQKKIGNYFQKLDKQIDLQQKELEKLKNIKKASLSKMFV
ncbi:restriction endonuclease subunit S [Aliarcobacter butzleri]|uniref:restriction endonuclease subunit S n=1 Tax=Aliarcobacter butzleri TaxID=28197 RepID=UPI0021B20CDF|nr:restriction endonuclease subunit S [Aliarcobacter butzleri]MCT7646024.1 restriction endonuclease subunit S [Aliarcobacter butzleri]